MIPNISLTSAKLFSIPKDKIIAGGHCTITLEFCIRNADDGQKIVGKDVVSGQQSSGGHIFFFVCRAASKAAWMTFGSHWFECIIMINDHSYQELER